MYGIVKKVRSTKKRFRPAEVYKVPVQMTTRSQVHLLNSDKSYQNFQTANALAKKSSGLCNFFRASKICLLPALWACDLKNLLRRLYLCYTEQYY